MASTDARPVPEKNVAYRLTFPLYMTDGTGLVVGAAGLDSEVDKDGAGFNDCTNEATQIGSSGVYYIDLTNTEMNADTVTIKTTSSTTGSEVFVCVMCPEEAGDIRVNVTQNAGTAITSASGIQEVKVASIAADAITATAIANGAIDAATFAAGAIDATAIANGAIDAATFAAGAIDAAALSADAGAEIADAVLNRDMSTGTDSGSPTVRTPRQALRLLRNLWTVSGGTLTVKKEDDTTTSWTSAITSDAAAEPITGSDPASA